VHRNSLFVDRYFWEQTATRRDRRPDTAYARQEGYAHRRIGSIAVKNS
jgi:hypothetical protein